MNYTCSCPTGYCFSNSPAAKADGFSSDHRSVRCKATIPAARHMDPPTAPMILAAAAQHMQARAATYDKPEGERSMGKTVEAFNLVTGRDLRESEGWLLMAILKMVRSEQRKDPHRDSLEDLTAYSALMAEARLAGN